MKNPALIVAIVASLSWANVHGSAAPDAQVARINVAVDQPGHRIPPQLWGIFFEDINLSADGGLYPELVRNRSFEDAVTPEGWKFASVGGGTGTAGISQPDFAAKKFSPPLNAFNRRSLRVNVDGDFSLENEGYWGMNIQKGESYTFKVAARADDGFISDLSVKLIGAQGQTLAAGVLKNFSRNWEYFTNVLVASASDPRAHLQISSTGKGVLFLDMVSLLPKRTWKNHGLRWDLGEALDGLHPKFLRFPGGCWVEGNDLAQMYRWKRTIGNVDVREPLWNIWNYNATHGLGYHEYLQLAEDLGAVPLFCINAGMSHKEVVPLDRMGEWVQDALDAIEYANGPTNTVWGGLRAKAGHPEPFNLKYLEIGNENGGHAYGERWPLFVEVMRAKHPEIKLIVNHWQGSHPGLPVADLVDEHYYNTPEWFMRQAGLYDDVARSGPKIFVGEYAVNQRSGKGNLRGAVGEAAFMTGLERNSDQVVMACYAPLLVNLNHRAWPVNLINFDSANWFGLPSYYVQKMFAENPGDVSLPVNVESPVVDTSLPGGQIGVGTWNTAAEFRDIKVTAPDGKVLLQADFSQGAKDWQLLGKGAAWKTQGGVLRQTAEVKNLRALAGGFDWLDYTLTLQARKLSGAEGFLVLFRVNAGEDRSWWNLGAWGNTGSAVEIDETMDRKPIHIATDRWYDIKIVAHGKNVKCYLDGKLVHDINCDPGHPVKSVYASAAQDEMAGDLIVKVVNADSRPRKTEINLNGAKAVTGKGNAIVLTSESATDENSLANPTKVSPINEPVEFSGTTLKRTFPGNSFTVLRLHTHEN